MPRLDRVVSDFFVDFPFVDKASNASFKTTSNEGKSFGGTDFVCTVLLAAVENKGLKFEFLTTKDRMLHYNISEEPIWLMLYLFSLR